MLSRNLKRLRANRGLSQQRVADMNGLTRSTYNNYEQGIAEPNLCTAVKLAEFFKVTVKELIKGEQT